jgi:hypothetical protein
MHDYVYMQCKGARLPSHLPTYLSFSIHVYILQVMLPRMGYLPLATADAISFFSHLAPESGPQKRVWFETTESKIPLKW